MPQCPAQYSPMRNRYVVSTVAHQNVGLPEDTVSGVLGLSPYRSFSLYCITLNLGNIRILLENERIQSFASEWIQITSGEEAGKAACNFTASVASAYRVPINKVTISNLNSDLPGLGHLLIYTKKIVVRRYLTLSPKTIRRMTCRNVREPGGGDGKPWGHTSSCVFYCEVPCEKVLIRCTSRYS